MSALPDELEKLLGDCRKTISENAQFLKALKEDSVDPDDKPDGAAEDNQEEEFEEL
jgi:hypothetical protein